MRGPSHPHRSKVRHGATAVAPAEPWPKGRASPPNKKTTGSAQAPDQRCNHRVCSPPALLQAVLHSKDTCSWERKQITRTGTSLLPWAQVCSTSSVPNSSTPCSLRPSPRRPASTHGFDADNQSCWTSLPAYPQQCTRGAARQSHASSTTLRMSHRSLQAGVPSNRRPALTNQPPSTQKAPDNRSTATPMGPDAAMEMKNNTFYGHDSTSTKGWSIPTNTAANAPVPGGKRKPPRGNCMEASIEIALGESWQRGNECRSNGTHGTCKSAGKNKEKTEWSKSTEKKSKRSNLFSRFPPTSDLSTWNFAAAVHELDVHSRTPEKIETLLQLWKIEALE